MTKVEAPSRPEAPAGWEKFRSELRSDALQADPLLDCLVELTRVLGRPTSRTVLAGGLPLGKGGMTPSVFGRAAARAGLATKVLRRDLDQLQGSTLPLVLLLQGDTACVLLGWEGGGVVARLLMPEAGQGVVLMPRKELQARYLGLAISALPKFKFDDRAPAVHERKGHWFWTVVAEQIPLYRDILGAALLINLFALALPLFTMNVYDRVVPNFAVETLWMLAAGMALVLLVDYIVRMLRGHFVDLAGSRIDVKLSAAIMEKVLGMKLANRPVSVGAFASNLRSFEMVRDFIASATVTAIVDLPFAVLFIALIAWISWPLVFAPLVGLLIVIGYSWTVQKRMQVLSETTFRAAATRNAVLVESLTGIETIKAHGAERVMQTRLEDSSVFLARVSAQLRLLSSSVLNGVMAVQQSISLALIVAGVYLIAEGQLTMGGLIAVSMLSGRAMGPMGQMAALLMQYQNARTALKSLDQTMTAPTERGGMNYLHRPDVRGEIALQNVSFQYPGRDQDSLRGITCRIQAGEHVVILGRVGSGKTTLQRLVLGLYTPTTGTVSVDGIDLRQIDPAELRRNIGHVAQDPLLFYGSLRDNIAIAAPHVDDAAVLAAAELGGLASFVNSHPQGFDMLIGERGESLSGGQRQGIAIARAALLEPRILLLDEPTGAMDYTTEAQFKERLRAYAKGRTLVIVTHRTSLLDLADRVMVMDEGRLVADGPREQVLADLQAGRVGRAA